MQPKPEDYDYDLEETLTAVVGVRALVPSDAFTADTLGTEREGNGVIIRRDGLVLTIGYLITEAETIWLSLDDGRVIPGHVIGYDQETGFGLVQALARIELPAVELGASAGAKVGEDVVVGGAGGRMRAVAARIVAKQEFVGYWEYALDEAIYTMPAHPHWGGTALLGSAGQLLGIGSLKVQHVRGDGGTEDLNMIVPIDLLKPIFDDMLTLGRANRPARPWLGVFATEVGKRVVIAGLAGKGPAAKASLKSGDVVLRVAGTDVKSLATFFRRVWALGEAGVEVPLLINRQGQTFEVKVRSGDRRRFLKGPTLH